MDTSRLFLRETTRVPPHALLLFGATAAELDIERVKQTGRVRCAHATPTTPPRTTLPPTPPLSSSRDPDFYFLLPPCFIALQVDLAAGVRVRVSPEGALLFKLLRRELDKLLVRMGGVPAEAGSTQAAAARGVVDAVRALLRRH